MYFAHVVILLLFNIYKMLTNRIIIIITIIRSINLYNKKQQHINEFFF